MVRRLGQARRTGDAFSCPLICPLVNELEILMRLGCFRGTQIPRIFRGREWYDSDLWDMPTFSSNTCGLSQFDFARASLEN